MKAAVLLVFVLMLSAAAQAPAVHAVYLFTMTNGMDQYLASRLTSEGVFQVVTDPTRAQAVFTDRLGEGFEQHMAELFAPKKPATPPAPPPTPPEKAAAAEKAPLPTPDKPKEAAKAGPAEKPAPVAKDKQDKAGPPSPSSMAVTEESGPPRISSFSRGRGNFFLVDVKTRAVLWSVYERPRDATPDELSRTAKRVVENLKKTFSPKQPQPQS